MINLDVHQVENIAVVSRVFNTFSVYEFTFVDKDGRRTTVKAFTHRPEQVEIERMPDEDCSK
jgi:putative heme iron utilization protein